MGVGKGMPNVRVASPALTRHKVPQMVASAVRGFDPADLQAEDPSLLVSIGAGANDVWQGLKQIHGKAMDWHDGGHRYADITAEQMANDALYERGRKAHGHTGFDVGRGIGNTLATLPISVLAKGYQGANTLGKVLKVAGRNMAVGGASGGVTFVKDGDTRLGGIVAGAAIGGVSDGLGAGLGKAVQKVARRLPQSRAQIGQSAAQLVDSSLGSWGYSPAHVAPHLRQGLINEVEAAMHAGKTVAGDEIPKKLQRMVIARQVLSENRPNAHIHEEALRRALPRQATGRVPVAAEQMFLDRAKIPLSVLEKVTGPSMNEYERAHSVLGKRYKQATAGTFLAAPPSPQTGAPQQVITPRKR